MTLPIDGSADHELHIKGVAGLQVGDWRESEPGKVQAEIPPGYRVEHGIYRVEPEMDREGEDYHGLAYDHQT